jgi:hypothetical protein
LDEYDRLILNADYTKVGKRKLYSISTADRRQIATFLINGRGRLFTLSVPDNSGAIRREICGFAWTGGGAMSVLIHYTEAPYFSETKSENLGSRAARGAPLEGSLCFSSRPVGENGQIEGIPEGIVGSQKNGVIEDAEHQAILVVYKLGATACSCQSVRMITPLIAFALAVAIVAGPK